MRLGLDLGAGGASVLRQLGPGTMLRSEARTERRTPDRLRAPGTQRHGAIKALPSGGGVRHAQTRAGAWVPPTWYDGPLASS